MGLQPARLEALKNRCAEAIANGIEHADATPERAGFRTRSFAARVIVAISNAGSAGPARAPETPDLLAKLVAASAPRVGPVCSDWRTGECVIDDAGQYTVELTFFLSGPQC
jgi:hypothetical protein